MYQRTFEQSKRWALVTRIIVFVRIFMHEILKKFHIENQKQNLGAQFSAKLP